MYGFWGIDHGVAHFAFTFALLSVLMLSGIVAYTVTVVIIYSNVEGYTWLVVYGFCLVLGGSSFVVFGLSWVMVYRLLKMSTDYEIACLMAARMEGPPKPFNLDLY